MTKYKRRNPTRNLWKIKRILRPQRQPKSLAIPSPVEASVAALSMKGAAATVALLANGATLPFIARYRQAATGISSESQLRKVEEEFKKQTTIFEKKTRILRLVKGKPTRAMRMVLCDPHASAAAVDEALGAAQRPVSDAKRALYEEYEDAAREVVWCVQSCGACNHGFESRGAAFVIATEILRHPGLREKLGKIKKRRVTLMTSAIDISAPDDFARPLIHIKGYQWLKIRRQEREGRIRVVFEEAENRDADLQDVCAALGVAKYAHSHAHSPCGRIFEEALNMFMTRYLPLAMRRDWRRELDATAEAEALEVFRENLKQKLLLAPVRINGNILAVDPGIAKGNKCAVVNSSGDVLHAFNFMASETSILLIEAEKFGVKLIAVGNGTGGAELLRTLAKFPGNFSLCQVDECAASVYSISPLAVRELANFPPLTRGAISLARRVLDPLTEFLKIPPISLGVGMYQKDISEKKLECAANDAAAWAIAQVGIDVNMASVEILSRLPGLSVSDAEKICKARLRLGRFSSRQEISALIDPVSFRNIAGILRIFGASEFLDSTGVHPESYGLARKLGEILRKFGVKTANQFSAIFPKIRDAFTFKDSSVVEEISREIFMGDPRVVKQEIFGPGEFPEISRIAVGSVFSATVRNVVEFGVFVDLLGTSDSALLHRSEFLDERNFAIGDKLAVKIIRIENGRIAVSAKLE